MTNCKQLLLKLQQRSKLQEQINQADCRNKDRENKESQIEALNEEIQKEHEEQRERKEAEAIEKIKVNPKEFFKFANKTKKKSKSKIGPLRSGDSHWPKGNGENPQ